MVNPKSSRSLNVESESSLLVIYDTVCGISGLVQASSEASLPITVYRIGDIPHNTSQLKNTARQTLVIVMARLQNLQVG